MKFKVLKGTPLFDKLIAFRKEMALAEKAAYNLAAEFGSESIITSRSMHVIAGGITGMQLRDKPALWIKSYPKHYDDVYFPARNKSENKELLSRIDSLPLISNQDYNALIGFNEQQVPNNRRDGSMSLLLNASLAYKKDTVVIDVDSRAKYEPVKGMTEILESEYNRLMELPEVSIKELLD